MILIYTAPKKPEALTKIVKTRFKTKNLQPFGQVFPVEPESQSNHFCSNSALKKPNSQNRENKGDNNLGQKYFSHYFCMQLA